MADYVYLLETRLSLPQRTALTSIREVARQHGLTLFLVGGAVRDLISGSPVRDLDVVVQGNALGLRKALEAAGALYSGESARQQALYLRFPNGVRLEVGSALAASYPKPGKPVYTPTTILEDLRRRDFTANAMALSLNEGSYGLLMDPLNGVADIENRELRLVSNYGFIEDPARMIRAARYMARLGWHMDERTQSRYETGKAEGYISAMQPADRAYETEELFHEEEPLRVMRRLEEEGWLQHLAPALGVAHANVAELAKLRESQLQLETRGIRVDAAAATFPLLTAKIPSSALEAIKAAFPRAGFVQEINVLEAEAKELSGQLVSKAMTKPSEAYQLLMRSNPVTVLWAAYSTRSAVLQARFKSFYTEWPQAQQKIPHLLLNEMRIVPDLPEYDQLLEKLFFALMDGRLGTPEEMRAFLEPYSPPAPPPPVSLRRARAPRKEAKAPKSRKKPSTVAEVDAAEAAGAELTPAAEQPGSGQSAATPVAPPAISEQPARKKSAPASAAKSAAPAKAPAGKHSAPQKSAPAVKQAGSAKVIAAKQAAPPRSAKPVAAKSAPSKPDSSGKSAKPGQKPASKAATPARAAAKGKPAPKKAAPLPLRKAPAKSVAKPVSKPVKLAAKKTPAKQQPAKKAAVGAKGNAAKKGASAKKAPVAQKAAAKKTAPRRR